LQNAYCWRLVALNQMVKWFGIMRNLSKIKLKARKNSSNLALVCE